MKFILWGELLKHLGMEHFSDLSILGNFIIDEELLRKMDVIITLCGNAEESRPYTPPEIRRMRWPIEDPATAIGTEEEIVNVFRRVRDEIKQRLEKFLREIQAA